MSDDYKDKDSDNLDELLLSAVRAAHLSHASRAVGEMRRLDNQILSDEMSGLRGNYYWSNYSDADNDSFMEQLFGQGSK